MSIDVLTLWKTKSLLEFKGTNESFWSFQIELHTMQFPSCCNRIKTALNGLHQICKDFSKWLFLHFAMLTLPADRQMCTEAQLRKNVLSQTSFVIFFCRCPIHWKSTLQTEKALISSESKCMALSCCLCESFPICCLLFDQFRGALFYAQCLFGQKCQAPLRQCHSQSDQRRQCELHCFFHFWNMWCKNLTHCCKTPWDLQWTAKRFCLCLQDWHKNQASWCLHQVTQLQNFGAILQPIVEMWPSIFFCFLAIHPPPHLPLQGRCVLDESWMISVKFNADLAMRECRSHKIADSQSWHHPHSMHADNNCGGHFFSFNCGNGYFDGNKFAKNQTEAKMHKKFTVFSVFSSKAECLSDLERMMESDGFSAKCVCIISECLSFCRPLDFQKTVFTHVCPFETWAPK